MLSVSQVGVVLSTAMTVGMNVSGYYLPLAQWTTASGAYTVTF